MTTFHTLGCADILRAYTLYASAEGALNRQITFTHAADSRLFSRVARKFDIALGVARVYKDLLKSKTRRDIKILKNKSFSAFCGEMRENTARISQQYALDFL